VLRGNHVQPQRPRAGSGWFKTILSLVFLFLPTVCPAWLLRRHVSFAQPPSYFLIALFGVSHPPLGLGLKTRIIFFSYSCNGKFFVSFRHSLYFFVVRLVGTLSPNFPQRPSPYRTWKFFRVSPSRFGESCAIQLLLFLLRPSSVFDGWAVATDPVDNLFGTLS